ncbi:augmin complex subunit dgt3 [Drosophila grimshawi]|uniref:GH11813 n=1 Tax=Drosophila grimshawi TaxID=7222 RepID=B4JIS1_DROGR|nr:augmin complex subunit dgt3 [Drosophila grimshawi]EDW00518.1 GH11813 [Drosophila grimshawi]
MGDLLNNTEMLKKLGIDSANQWIIYDERFEKFFQFLFKNISDSNILTDHELLARDEMMQHGEWLNETERQLKLQQIEAEWPGLLEHTDEDLEALSAEIEQLQQATNDYNVLIDEMKNTKHSININLSELEYEIRPLQVAERELLGECQKKAGQLEQLQRHNRELVEETSREFTMQQMPPLFMHQLPLDQYFLKCDSFLQYFTLYMKDNFKIQEYAEFESIDVDIQQMNSKLENLQNSMEYYTLAYIKKKATATATKALCDQLDLNRITCLSLKEMVRETHNLQLLNENHLSNTHNTLETVLAIHVQQRIQQRIEMVLYENTKQKLERAMRRRESDKQLTSIISDALLNAELIWIAIQLDLEKKRNFKDNSQVLGEQAEACWERVQAMLSVNASNKNGAVCAQFVHEIASQLSAHLGQNVRSTEAKSCLYEYEKFGRLLAYSLQSMLNEKSHVYVHEQLADLKRVEEKLRPFVYDSPLEQPMFDHTQYLYQMFNVAEQQLSFDKAIRHLRTQFQETITQRMDNEKLYRYSKLLWIWFLTQPERVIHAIDEVKKCSAKMPALNSSMLRPGGGLQRK